MTVRINKPALNLREELTKAQSVVPYVQQQFWMDGLVENGTFDTADGWTLGTGWSISGGVATATSATSLLDNTGYITKFPANKSLLVVFEITNYSGGSVRPIIAGGTAIAGTYRAGNGTYSELITNTTNRYMRMQASGFSGAIDNVSVFEVDASDNVIHSVPLGFKPVHVYEDGLLQREGENYDYTVVDTGFEYQIKPTVAPSATTETCVIAEREL